MMKQRKLNHYHLAWLVRLNTVESNSRLKFGLSKITHKIKSHFYVCSTMMKKVFVTILAFVYLTVSSGATVHMHYCMGKLESWDLSPKTNGKCGACGMQKAGHKGCCHDTQKQVKIEKDQKISASAFLSLKIFSDAIVLNNTGSPLVYITSFVSNDAIAHAPPAVRRSSTICSQLQFPNLISSSH